MTTITEALSEIKTLKARIAKRRGEVIPRLVRPAVMRDPMEKEGGVAQWIERELQAIADMAKRYVDLRVAIQQKNLATTLTIGGKTHTIAHWLTWRREVSGEEVGFVSAIARSIQNVRNDPQYRGRQMKPEGEAGDQDFIVHVSEKELAEQADSLTVLLGELDGKLSLLNATTTIDI